MNAEDNTTFCSWITSHPESPGFSADAEGPFGSSTSQVGDTSWYFTRLYDGVNSLPVGYISVSGGTIVDQGNMTMSSGLFFWTGNYYGVVWNNPGQGYIEYTSCNSSSYGCCETNRLNVQVAPSGNLDAPIFGPELVCDYDTSIYFTPNDPGFTYNWTVSGGAIISGQGTAQIEIDWYAQTLENEGGYVLLTKSGGGLGTSSVKQINTSLFSLSTPSAQVVHGPSQVCGGTSRKYHASMQAGSYSWTVQGGTIQSGQGTDTIQVQWPSFSSGSGTVEVAAIGNPACFVNPVTRSMNVNVSNSSQVYPQVLSSPTALINSTVTYATTLYAGHTYQWTVTGGNIVSGQGTNQVMVQWTSSGSQTLTLVENGPSCGPSSQVIPVNVTGFSVNISATDTTTYTYGGSANCTQLTANTSPVPSNPTYNWSTGDVTPTISVCPTTTTTYSVTVSDPSAGTQTNSFTVTVLPAPTCNGGTGIQICRSFGPFTFNQCVTTFSLPTYLAQGATLGPCPNKTGQPSTLEAGPSLLLQPNPWSEHCRLTIELPQAQRISVSMTDIHGKEVRKIFNGKVQAAMPLELSLEKRELAAGLYFIRLETEYQGTEIKKTMLY